MHLYFDAKRLPKPSGEYVAWVDGMGTGKALESSLAMAANFVMKLHLAFARTAKPSGVRLYPVMDGVYVTSANKSDIQSFVRGAYKHLAEEFVSKQGVLNRFVVRTGIAYGATIHGGDVPDQAFGDEARNSFTPEVSDRLGATRPMLLLSSAMVNAYRCESKAAPFGVYVHDSALTLPQISNHKDKGFQDRYWKWWLDGKDTDGPFAQSLAQAVMAYLGEASTKPRSLAYPLERLEEHRSAAKEYFAELLDESGG